MNKIIPRFISETLNAAQASHKALAGHNENYHFLMSLEEHGESTVHRTLVEQISSRDGLNIVEGTTAVNVMFKNIKEASEGNGICRIVREKLNADKEVEAEGIFIHK